MMSRVASKTMTVLIAVLLLSALVPVNGPAAAQGSGEKYICYGWYSLNPNNDHVVSGTISNNEPVHNWVFQGEAGTFATIHMEVIDGTLDPFVYVTDKTTGQRIVSSSANDMAGRKIITILNVPLGSDGDYVITATRLGEASGATAGTYRLGLEAGMAVSIRERYTNWTYLLESAIYDGEVVQSELPAVGYDVWYFEGQRGQQVSVVARALEGMSFNNNHDLWLYVLTDNSWQHQQTAQNTNNELRITNYQLQTTGTFAILMYLDSSRYPLKYELTLGGAGGMRPELPPCRSADPECPAIGPTGVAGVPVVDEIGAAGSITAAQPISVYQFIAYANDVVTVQMQRTGGSLDTFLGLADARGNILARDEGFDPAMSSIYQFVVPADGCYFVYASRAGVSDGTTEGTFLLTVSGLPSAGGGATQPPDGVTFGGDISVGQSVTGSVGVGGWQVAYRFQSSSGGTITFSAMRMSGDLAPALALLDANHNQLDYVSASFAGNASNPLVLTAEPGATYFIIVQREGGEFGTSSGDFALTVAG